MDCFIALKIIDLMNVTFNQSLLHAIFVKSAWSTDFAAPGSKVLLYKIVLNEVAKECGNTATQFEL